MSTAGTTRHPSGRWRRRLGLTLLAGGIAWAITMAVSTKWWFGYCSRFWVADIGDGSLYFRTFTAEEVPSPLIGWCCGENIEYRRNGTVSWMWTWWIWGEQIQSWEKNSAYSIWPLAPILLLTGAAMSIPGARAARRKRRNQCPRCGYSRAGLATMARCPECGEEPAMLPTTHPAP